MIPLSSARQQALLLLDNLTIIQTLQKTEEKLQELLLEESYPEAIRVLLGRWQPDTKVAMFFCDALKKA